MPMMCAPQNKYTIPDNGDHSCKCSNCGSPQQRCMMVDLCSNYPDLPHPDMHNVTMKAVWEMWLLTMISMGNVQIACIRMTSERRNRFITKTPILQCNRAWASFQRRKNCNEEVKVKMNSPENMAMSWRCLLSLDSFHGWGSIFALRQKKIKNIHVSWWQWQSWLKDIEESHWTNNSPSVSGEDL